jgi:hypothetical protein
MKLISNGSFGKLVTTVSRFNRPLYQCSVSHFNGLSDKYGQIQGASVNLVNVQFFLSLFTVVQVFHSSCSSSSTCLSEGSIHNFGNRVVCGGIGSLSEAVSDWLVSQYTNQLIWMIHFFGDHDKVDTNSMVLRKSTIRKKKSHVPLIWFVSNPCYSE